jgi:bifunctional UDP-N-acetylglucosamine pyrophosphorylase/glucosamine-1-phosphate N-acetyltransferase
MSRLAAIVLAAGKGTRMKSDLPKVLHRAAGKSLVEWVLESVRHSSATKFCLVLGGDLNPFAAILEKYKGEVSVCVQQERRGTGDAVSSAGFAFSGVNLPSFAKGELIHGAKIEADEILICAGDVPNMNGKTLKAFVDDARQKNAIISVLGMRHPNPFGYGRMVADKEGNFVKIVEEKDANDDEKKITLCNSGVIYGRTKEVFKCLGELTTNNTQGEYYLTEVFQIGRRHGLKVTTFETNDWQQFEGVNDPEQLASVERLILSRQ